MAQNTRTVDSEKTYRFPLVGNNQQRNTTSDTDQKFVNLYPETSKNQVTGTSKLFLVKRPGFSLETTVVSGGAAGRGAWSFNNKLYTVFGNTLYEDGVAKQVLSTSTGMCGATEVYEDKKMLFLADGIDAWTINTTGTVTKVDTIYLSWQANDIIEVGDRRRPAVNNGYWYTATVAGTTGATAPTWPTTVGATVTDGSVTWKCSGSYTPQNIWAANTAYALGTIVIPMTETGYYYKCTVSGISASTEPDWPLVVGDSIINGDLTWECVGQYGGFPSPHIPTPVYLDGYIFLPEADSQDIYNSDVNHPHSWGALSFITAENFSDPLVGLARQNNYVVAFGSSSTELFYDKEFTLNQNTDTEGLFQSPLQRNESIMAQVGCLSYNTLLQSERLLMFIGESGIGGKSVWMMDGTTFREISLEYIEKFIDAETSPSAITGYGFRVNGHMFFHINLPTVNKTFVYDVEEKMWHEWSYLGAEMPFVWFVEHNNKLLLQHISDGKMYKLSTTTYQDAGSDMTCEVVTAKFDFETDNRKFFKRLSVIGDTQSTALQLRWSDDDYTTWNSWKILETGMRPRLYRLGAARRRAFHLKHVGNYPTRLEALEMLYSVGEH